MDTSTKSPPGTAGGQWERVHGKSVRARGSQFAKTASLSNVRSYTHEVSPRLILKHELNETTTCQSRQRRDQRASTRHKPPQAAKGCQEQLKSSSLTQCTSIGYSIPKHQLWKYRYKHHYIH